jgi:hypothetical protein
LVELKGSLSGIGLLAILQLIGEVRHSGNLELHKDSITGTLAFDDGRLVAAESGELHGLQALASCVLELSDADFTFVEGIPALERTLDLGPAELRKLLDRITGGDLGQLVNGVDTSEATEVRAATTCARLGFADDNARHYSRPTALHRCYAGGAPCLVTIQEQRELCLAGHFAACPRFRNAEPPTRPATATHEPRPTTAVVERPTPPPVSPAKVPESAPAAVPPGVAARMAAGSQLQMSPPGVPDRPSSKAESGDTRRSPRSFALIAGGAALGFLLIGLILLVILPALRPSQPDAPTSPDGFESIAQPTRAQAIPPPIATPPAAVATAASRARPTSPAATTAASRARPTSPAATTAASSARPTSPAVAATTAASSARPTSPAVAATTAALTGPTPELTPSVVSRPSTPSPLSRPTAAAQAVRSIVDLRFALGPSGDWLDNAPYSAWSDGAYRFQARDATHFVAVGVPIDQVMSDVVVSATLRKTGGPPGGGFGLIVRDQGPEPRDGVNQEMNAYVFETGDQGDYGVWRRDGDHWVDLVPWMHSPSVRSGGSPNDLVVRAVGDMLIFSVNGSDVATIHDDALDAGGVGIFVGGDNNEVALDHFSVQLPD